MKKLVIIGIGAAYSGLGKTSLAEALLRYLTAEGGGRLAPSPGMRMRWGALKYTKTALLTSIVDDPEALKIEDKDTCRLSNAGAEHVVWLQAPPEDLPEAVPLAIGRLEHLDGIIVEGNSAIEFAKPDVILFIQGDEPNRIKPSGRLLHAKADIIISHRSDQHEGQTRGGTEEEAHTFRFESMLSHKSAEGLLEVRRLVGAMEEIIRDKRVEDLLAERSREGRISCKEARKIAEETGASYSDVGRAANRLHIKIRNCELGCF